MTKKYKTYKYNVVDNNQHVYDIDGVIKFRVIKYGRKVSVKVSCGGDFVEYRDFKTTIDTIVDVWKHKKSISSIKSRELNIEYINYLGSSKHKKGMIFLEKCQRDYKYVDLLEFVKLVNRLSVWSKKVVLNRGENIDI